MRPNTRMTAPHHQGNTLIRSKVTRRIPYMAVLSITPLIRAAAFEGATESASGSQTWRGITPAFAAKPKNARKKATAAHEDGISILRIASNVYPLKLSNPVAKPAIRPKERRMAIAPTWAMTKYKKAALLFSVLSSSNMTRKYDEAAITSHDMRKKNASSASTTMNIPARSRE